MDIHVTYDRPDEGRSSVRSRPHRMVADRNQGRDHLRSAGAGALGRDEQVAREIGQPLPGGDQHGEPVFRGEVPVRPAPGLHPRQGRQARAAQPRGRWLDDQGQEARPAPARHRREGMALPDRPTIQLSLPYLFITDEPVYMSQVAPFMHYRREPLPGTIFGGRFPINLWPRPLMWAFEWHDIETPIRISRG